MTRVNLPLARSLSYADNAMALQDTGIESYPPSQRCLETMGTFDKILSWWGGNNLEFIQYVRANHPAVDFLQALPREADIHITEFRRDQLNQIFGSTPGYSATPRIHWTEDEDRFANEFWNSYPKNSGVAIHPGASGARKRWPAQNFAKVARSLSRDPSHKLLLLEGPLDSEAVKQVRVKLGTDSTCWETLRIEDLNCLAAVLSHCQLYIGNDSGITHLAAALGIRTIALFLETDPRVWAPRGPRVQVLSRPSLKQVLAFTEL